MYGKERDKGISGKANTGVSLEGTYRPGYLQSLL